MAFEEQNSPEQEESQGRQGGFQRRDNFERKMYQGNWTCAKCGGAITELPFDPDPSRLDQLQCRECHMKNRPPRRNRF